MGWLFGSSVALYRRDPLAAPPSLGTTMDSENSYFDALGIRYLVEGLTGFKALRTLRQHQPPDRVGCAGQASGDRARRLRLARDPAAVNLGIVALLVATRVARGRGRLADRPPDRLPVPRQPAPAARASLRGRRRQASTTTGSTTGRSTASSATARSPARSAARASTGTRSTTGSPSCPTRAWWTSRRTSCARTRPRWFGSGGRATRHLPTPARALTPRIASPPATSAASRSRSGGRRRPTSSTGRPPSDSRTTCAGTATASRFIPSRRPPG